MIDIEKIIKGIESCLSPHDPNCNLCPYDSIDLRCRMKLRDDVMALLKAQEPRLVVKEDFVNADKWGYLPVYVEGKDGDMYWDCITDAALGDTISRFWTAKPTDEQRKAVKWDDSD